MSLIDSLKNIMHVPEEDEYDEEEFDLEGRSSKNSIEEEYETTRPKKEKAESPRIIKRSAFSSKTQQPVQEDDQMKVVLVKPNCFEDVTGIADHLNSGRSVVLNLEEAHSEVARRIVDFLSGAAYANRCDMRKVAKNTFIIVAHGIGVSGELMLDEIGEMYY